MIKDLLSVIKNAGDEAHTLKDLKQEINFMDTPKLVSGYILVKNYSKMMDYITNTARNELLYGSGLDTKDYKGRFFGGDVKNDMGGNLYLSGTDNERLKAQKRVMTKLNEKWAAEILQDAGLYQYAIDKCVVSVDINVIDELNKLKELLIGLLDVFQPDSVPEQLTMALGELTNIISRFVVEEKISKDKISSLVVSGHLSAEAENQIFEKKENYALITPRPKMI